MRKYLLLILTVCSLKAVAQTRDTAAPATYVKVMVEPVYKGNLKKLIEENLKYPEEAVKNNIKGVVLIEFTVEEKGTITDIHVAADSPQKDELLVKEATRVIKLTNGKWKPGVDNGRPVKNTISRAFYFAL